MNESEREDRSASSSGWSVMSLSVVLFFITTAGSWFFATYQYARDPQNAERMADLGKFDEVIVGTLILGAGLIACVSIYAVLWVMNSCEVPSFPLSGKLYTLVVVFGMAAMLIVVVYAIESITLLTQFPDVIDYVRKEEAWLFTAYGIAVALITLGGIGLARVERMLEENPF